MAIHSNTLSRKHTTFTGSSLYRTHTGLTTAVRTLIGTMQHIALCSNLNHHNLAPNPYTNPNLILTLKLKTKFSPSNSHLKLGGLTSMSSQHTQQSSAIKFITSACQAHTDTQTGRQQSNGVTLKHTTVTLR